MGTFGMAVRACVAAILAAACLGGCAAPEAPDQAVRDAVAQLQGDIDRRDTDAVLSVLAEDFAGRDGMDRRGARALAAGAFLRYRSVRVRLGQVEVTVQGETRANADFTAVLTGGTGVLPESAQVYDVRTGWRREEDEWFLVSADWTPRL